MQDLDGRGPSIDKDTKEDLFVRLNRFLEKYGELRDTNLLIEQLLAEGVLQFQTDAGACWLSETENQSELRLGDEKLCELLSQTENSGSEVSGLISSSRTKSIIYFKNEAASSALHDYVNGYETEYKALVLFPIWNARKLLGAFAYLSDMDAVPERLVEQGAVLSQISRLVIQNSQLTDTMLSQSAEMGLLYQNSAALSVQLGKHSLVDHTLERGVLLLQADYGCIFSTDPESGGTNLISNFSSDHNDVQQFMKAAHNVEELVRREGRPLFLSSIPPSPAPGFEPQGTTNQNHCLSALAVPITWDMETIGTLVLLSASEPAAFSEHEIGQLRLVAFQVANAMGVSRLMQAEHEQRRFAEALQSASVIIGQKLHLDEVLDTILEQARHAFSCEAANVMVIENGCAMIARALGYEELEMDCEIVENLSLKINDHPNLLQMSEGEALYVPDISDQEGWVVHPGFNWCKSWAGVPILYNGALLGFLNLDSASTHAFSEQVLEQLNAFATHAAIALHKASLYERLSNEHHRLQQIYEVGRNISSSLDSDQILKQLLSASMKVLGGIYGAIFYLDQEKDDLTLALSENPLKLSNLHELYLVELLAKRIGHIQEPDCDYIAYSDQSYWLLGLPLRTSTSILGIALVWIPSASEFEQTWLDALATLGQQTALALTKAQQHLELQRRLDELTILQHVSGAIARQLEFKAILEELTDQLHEKLGYHTSQVYIREADQLILEQYSGPPPSVHKVHISEGVVGRVARTGIPVLIPDVSKDAQYIQGYEDTIAELAVPILQDRQAIGVINVETSSRDILDEGTRDLLLMLADQVSIALQNAELYRQVKETVENLESRVQARTAVLEAVAMQAQEADRAKAQFVADVSHELRTPLTNIGLYLDLLEHGPGERYQEYFHTMRRETDRLKGLIEQLLDISRLNAEQVDLKMEKIQVNDLLVSLVEDRHMMANNRGLALIVEIEDNLPVVEGDPDYLVQVMTNLLTNAMNYTPYGGEIRVLSRRHAIQHRQGVAFSVEDTGPGIPVEEQAEIFNRFFRGSAGKQSGVSGTGLGLAISQEIIKQHQGTIILNSEPGSGTTFTVWLPVEHEVDPQQMYIRRNS